GCSELYTLSLHDALPISGMILRREVSGEAMGRRDLRPIVTSGATVLGLWGIAVWVGSSIKYATVFAAILIGSLLVLAGIGTVLLDRKSTRLNSSHGSISY